MRDQVSYLSFVSVLNGQAARTASANGASVDVMSLNGGNNALVFVAQAGVITDGTHVFKVQDSPDNSVWTDVAAAFIQAPAVLQFTSGTAVGTMLKWGYIGQQRYARLVSTVSGTTTGGFYTAFAVLALPANAPAA
jgi:hypothetical protein